MPVVRTVPKESLFKEVSAKFNFEYQTAGIYAGSYTCINPIVEVMKMKVNTFYLIDEICLSGSIPENVFVDSFNPTTPLELQLKRSVSGEMISAQKMVVSQYLKGHSISSHVECNRGNDGVQVRITGILNQVVETIGISTISINLTLSSYQIDGMEYNKYYRGSDSGNSRLRG